jgi:hypothetical protein
MVQANGDVYEGEWSQDVMRGQGVMNYADIKASYNGVWLNGVRHGYGVITHEDGGRYEGEWEADEKHGKGVYVFPSGSSLHGHWTRDFQQGHAEKRSDTGALLIVGKMCNSYFHGPAVFYHADGIRSQCKFIHGQEQNERTATLMRDKVVYSVVCTWEDDAASLLEAKIAAATQAAADIALAPVTESHAIHPQTLTPKPTSFPAHVTLCTACSKPVLTRNKHRVVRCKRGHAAVYHTHCLDLATQQQVRKTNACANKTCTQPIVCAQEMRTSDSVMRELF